MVFIYDRESNANTHPVACVRIRYGQASGWLLAVCGHRHGACESTLSGDK